MAAHSTKLAGLTYARGLDEASGHVAGAKAEYRQISREWHAWLGLGGYFTKKGDGLNDVSIEKLGITAEKAAMWTENGLISKKRGLTLDDVDSPCQHKKGRYRS
ncbi:hypothetical protein H9L39_18353 [Fusarium oxysporum f. sp. albedinis]|nr:hypothetical protein H9L39_18353 [Fusarium oxysporum f. sp. albedinis]